MGAAVAELSHADLTSAAGQPDIRGALLPALTAPERLGAHWRDLAEEAAEPNVFAEPWFIEASLRNIESARDVRILEVWSGTTLIGLLLLSQATTYARLPVPHVENWLHAHSFLGTPLVRRGHEKGFWTAALETLDQESWAKSFLHLEKLVSDGPIFRGLAAAARELGRPCGVVHRSERALLESDLSPEAYYEQTVRKKKHKELKRLSNRLAEMGRVETRWLASPAELAGWCDDFLELEARGWKGAAGSAMICDESSKRFFREIVAGAFKGGKLDFVRFDLDGRPLAMLVNLLAPPGGFSFKIAFDEDYARFSPGVLIQIDNLRILSRPEIGWMDSCAVEDHPMINSFWGERRHLVHVTLPLRGAWRGAAFRICRLAEDAAAAARRLRRPANSIQREPDDD